MIETTDAAPQGRAFPGAVLRPSAATAWLSESALLPILLIGIVGLRCWVAVHADLESDEPYYWLWSRHLAASYFDHPPMVAYAIRLGTALFGSGLLGLRSMAILAVLGTTALTYALALVLFRDRRIGVLAVLWFTLMPHTAFFSLVMYPDTPAMLFWVLCTVALAQVWRTGSGAWWYLAGAAMGLLLLSKYTGVFLLFGIGAWLLVSDEMRGWLRRREPYLGLLIALLMFSPVIAWNAQHGWASFIKQFGRALDSSDDGGISNMVEFVAIQAVFVTPLIFAFVVAGLAIAFERGLYRREANWLLLALTSAPMLIYFLAHALSAEVLAQWPSAAYPAGIVAAIAAFHRWEDRPGPSWARRYAFRSAPWVALAGTITLYVQLWLPVFPTQAVNDPLNLFAGWAKLAVDTLAMAEAQDAGYIATSDHDTNATLAFYLRDIPVFQVTEPIRYLNQPPIDQSLLQSKDGLYVAARGFDDLAHLEERYESVQLLTTIWRSRNGDPIEPYHIYWLSGYRGGVPY